MFRGAQPDIRPDFTRRFLKVASLFGRIEGWLERAVEGSTRAVFRQRLQPIELAKSAARAMQRQQLIGPDGVEVPNAFTVALHPDDVAEIAAYQASLEARISRYLSTLAQERGWTPVGPITVEIIGDERMRRRQVQVDGRMADPGLAPATRPVAPISATMPLPRSHRQVEAGSSTDMVVLCLEDGRQVGVPGGAIRIGRALDNDLVIADSRVSRYHAQIARDAGAVIVRDLGSTNGTTLGGRPLSEDRLGDGDRLSLGGYIIDVRLAPAGASPVQRGR
jgi:hypothetical protein